MVVNSMMMEHVQLIKNLLQDLQIAKSYEHAEEILSDPRQSETIYQFIEQRGGINEVIQARVVDFARQNSQACQGFLSCPTVSHAQPTKSLQAGVCRSPKAAKRS